MTEAAVSRACSALGLDRSRVLGATPVGGGCINDALRLHTTAGTFFLKCNVRAGHRFFQVEAEGLAALARAGAVKTPAVVARSRDSDPVPWLLLEWIEERRPDRAAWRRLGRELGALHRHEPGAIHGRAGAKAPDAGSTTPPGDPCYGWHIDNVIGSLPQPNRWTDDWGAFWAELRILPLARELHGSGAMSAGQLAVIDRAAARMGALIGPAAEADGGSLLHGDLWSGNVMFGEVEGGAGDEPAGDGAAGSRTPPVRTPVLIDPAVYIGHREVDLAMCRLFGGFPAAFHASYEATWPLQPGHERRLAAYQLYPLLVHARLFGGGYVMSALRAAEASLAACR
ncbi:MAG: fructosamine kinase family protein [Gemmatimonadetes bacterium]|nr:fructosamine kinase family protein [Gemmatimonadota bacterium]